MKNLSAFILGLFFCGGAVAADITMYYSPYCPHCHHAREFFSNDLVYEYPKLKVVQVNVIEEDNLPKFEEALKKCEYKTGGVPVIVVGDKCFQGYADFMQKDIRTAVEADLSDEDKKIAQSNKEALKKNPDEFRKQNSVRQTALTEYQVEKKVETQKKNKIDPNYYFYGILVVLIIALGIVLLRKDNK